MALCRYEGSMCQVSGAFWSYFFLEAPTMRTRKLHCPDEALPTLETFLQQTQEARVCRRAPAVREVIKGQRPTVSTWDNKDQVDCCAALHVVTGQLTTRLLEQPACSPAQTGQSQQQRWQGAFAAHLRDSARASPARPYPEVVIPMDHAPWHHGALIAQG
jgi:hypothetical protein